MQQRKFLILSFLTLALTLSADAQNNPPTVTPFGGSATSCSGDVVLYTGNCYSRSSSTGLPPGDITNTGDMTCVGYGMSQSGTPYVYVSVEHDVFSDPAGCAAGQPNFTDSVQIETRLISLSTGATTWTRTETTATSYGCPVHGRPNPPTVVTHTSSGCTPGTSGDGSEHD